MLSNSGHDSRGLYSGDTAGDQTGGEWSLVNWYQYPWDGGWHCVLHHPNANTRKLIAQLAIEAANNDNIGYDQAERYTYWQRLSSAGYYPSKIQTPCEADCSAGVLANCKAAGYILGDPKLQAISIYGYTRTMVDILTTAGFEYRNESKYLTGDSYLYAGDILLNVYDHTCTCVTDGANVEKQDDPDSYYLIKPVSLRKGDENKDVFRAKCILKARGFYKASLNYKYGNKAVAAAKLFQKAAGLRVSGCTYQSTWRTMLGLEIKDGYMVVKTCRLGDSNTSVLLLQEFLKALGYYTGKLDRSFGNATQKALKEFQKKAGLTVNGKWDKKTIEYMIG